MVLDRCISETGTSPTALLDAAKLYDSRWRAEAAAVSWMSVRSLFENAVVTRHTPFESVQLTFHGMIAVALQ